MDKLEKLHQLLQSQNLDNKTFEEFKANFGDNPEKQRQLHSFLVSKQMDNKSFEEFQSNFFSPLKKKDDSTLETEATDGEPTPISLDSSERKKYSDFLDLDEEFAKPQLIEQLRSKGFSVDETGIGDALLVTDNVTGEKTEIDLQKGVDIYDGGPEGEVLFTIGGDQEEEVAKLKGLLEKPVTPKSSLFSGNLLSDYEASAEDGSPRFSYINQLKDRYSGLGFDFETLETGHLKIKKGENETVVNIKPGYVDSNQFSNINQFIFDNITDEEASGLDETSRAKSYELVKKIETDIKNEVDLSEESVMNDAYNNNYFSNLFDYLDAMNIDTSSIPKEVIDELKRSQKQTGVNPRTGAARTVPYDPTDIQNALDTYFNEVDLGAEVDAYNKKIKGEVRDNLIDRATKLKMENIYKDMPNREQVTADVRKDLGELDDEEIEVSSNVKMATNHYKNLFDSVMADIQKLAKDNPGVAFNISEVDGQYFIESTDNSVNLQPLQDKLGNGIVKYYGEIAKYEKDLERINAKKDDVKLFKDSSKRNYNLVDLAIEDFKSAADNMVQSFIILGGLATGSEKDVDGARAKMAQNREKLEKYYETKRTYTEAYEEGSSGRFATRTFMEQAPNIALAIGTSGAGLSLGMTEAGVSTLVGTLFGLTSSGQKYDDLTTRQEIAADAQKAKDELEEVKDLMGDREYLESKYQLERAIKENDISSTDKTLAVLGTGLIEGTITKFFGTVPNSIKVLKDLRAPSTLIDDLMRSNYKAAGQFFKEIGKRTGGEIIEETSIEALTQVNDFAFIGDEMDFSQLDDVAVTSIITSGGMNVPGTAYSTFMSQVNVNRYKSKIKGITGEIQTMKDLLNNKDLTDIQRTGIHNKINALVGDVADVTTAMEGDALLLGSDNLKELLTLSGVKKGILSKAGIKPEDSQDIANEKLKNYYLKIDKKEAEKLERNLKYIQDRQNEIVGGLNYDNAIARVFGDKGVEIEKTLDPSLTPQQKYKEVYKQIRQEINDNALKEFQDAVQEQETRDIPDAQPAEGVQEVEEEVRVTPEEEAEVETTPKVEPLNLTKPTKKLKESFDNDTISQEDLEAMTLYALNKKQNKKRLTPFEKRLLEDTSVERTEQIADLQIKLEDNIKALREEELDLRTEAARKRKKAKEEVETKKFRDDQVVLKEETFTVTDEFGNKTVTTVKTNLDGSLRKAEVENFDEDGNSIRGEFVKLADNDIVVRDGITVEQLLTQRLQEGEVIEKTSERSGNEINNPKKTAQLTTDQKQKLGIETETKEEVEIKTEPATVEGAPDGIYLNVGMIEGKDGRELTEDEIESALPDGVEVLEKTRLEKGENVDEPTLSIKTSRALTDAEMKAFREATGQLAIPQIVDGEGTMFGTTDWGPFNPEFFVMPDKAKLSDVAKPATEGVSKLRGAFGRKAARTMRVNTLKQKLAIEQQAEKARKAIAKRYPNMKIEVFYSESDYHRAIGEADQSMGTYFNNKAYINLTRATETTVAHEVFHGILSSELKNNAQVQALMKRFVDSLSRSQDPALVAIFAEDVAKVEQYKNFENEEIMAELFGTLAGENLRLRPETKSLIKRFLDKLAKMFGLRQFTDSEVVDVLNTLAGKIATGQEVTTEDASLFNGGKVVDNPIQAITNKSVGGFDVQYTEDSRRQELIDKGLLVEANDVSGFAGNQVTITSPDDMLAGTVSIDGKQIFEGGGGIFFVTKYGDVWASGKKGTANTLAKMINDSLKINGGRGFLVLTKGADQKLISSVSGVNSSLSILDVMLDKGLISPSDFRSAVSGSVKKAGGIIKLGGSAKQLKSDVNKYFSDPTTTTFEKRGSVVKDIIGRLSQLQSVKQNSKQIIDILGGDTTKKLGVGNTKLSQSFGDLIAGVAAEQLTKGLSVGDVYGIIEVNSEVEVVEDSHPSYPFHVRLKDGSKPKLILPKNRQNGSEVLKTSTGKTYRVGNVSVLSGSFNQDIKPKKQVSGRPSMEEVYSKANEMGVSQEDARSFLKELGYTNKQIKDFVFEREQLDPSIAGQTIKEANNIFTKGAKKAIEFLDTIKRRLASAKGYLPKNVLIARETRDAHIQSEIKLAERAAKKLSKLMKGKSDEMYDKVDKFMRGEAVDLPIGIATVAQEMRNHIDALSTALVESGAITSGESATNIMNNIGEYMNRSYKLYDDKNYVDNMSDEVINEAKEYLKKQFLVNLNEKAKEEGVSVEEYLKEELEASELTLEEYVEAKATQSVNDILKKSEANEFIKASSIEGKKDVKILKERKDIPAEIRALMGEYTDPAYNYVMSVAKIKSLVENQKYLSKIKDIGNGVFLFKEKDVRRPNDYVRISAEGNQSLEPLDGYFAPKEMVDQLMKGSNLIDTNSKTFEKIYETWLKAVGGVKYAKTILSVGTHAKNVLGNLYFMAQNGYVDPKEFNNAFKVLKNDFMGMTDEQLNEKLDEYVKAGIINQGVSIREVKEMLEGDDNFDVRVDKRISDKTESKRKTVLKNAKKKIKQAGQVAEDLYQAEDDMFKIVAYENEKKRYAKALKNQEYDALSEKDKKEVDDIVIENVKNLLPNYSRLGGLAKGLRGFPVAGTFISFQLEAYRTAYNTIDIAGKEMKSENPEIRKIGSKRLASIVGFQAIKYGILSALGSAFAPEDEEPEDVMNVRPFLPPWSKNSDILVLQSGGGKFKYVDMSASDPYGGIARAINSIARGEDAVESFTGFMQEVLSPILSGDIFTSSVIKSIFLNQDSYGNPLYSAADSNQEKMFKIMEQFYDALEPGTATSIRKVFKVDDKFTETIGQLTGFRPREVDVKKQLSFSLKDIKEDVDAVNKIKTRAKYKLKDGEGTLQEYLDAIETVGEKQKENYKKANKLINASGKLGLPIYEPIQMMKGSGWSKKDKNFSLFYDTLNPGDD